MTSLRKKSVATLGALALAAAIAIPAWAGSDASGSGSPGHMGQGGAATSGMMQGMTMERGDQSMQGGPGMKMTPERMHGMMSNMMSNMMSEGHPMQAMPKTPGDDCDGMHRDNDESDS